jgi:hypothetical protein
MVAKVVALGGSVVTNFLLYRYVVWGDATAPEARGHGVGADRLPFETPRPSAPQEPQRATEPARS